MITATAILSIGVFIVALWGFGVARIGVGVLATAQSAVAVMRDENLDDEAREKTIQRASLELIKAFFSITVRSVLTFAVSLLPIWLASVAGLVTVAEVIDFLSRWEVIIVATVLIITGYIVRNRLWRRS